MAAQPQPVRLTPRDIPRFVTWYLFLGALVALTNAFYLPEFHGLALTFAPTATGTILSANRPCTGGTGSDACPANLVVRFTASNGQQIDFSDTDVLFGSQDHAGQHRTVRYNPANPYDAVIDVNPFTRVLILLGYWGFVALMCTAIFFYVRGNIRKEHQQKQAATVSRT